MTTYRFDSETMDACIATVRQEWYRANNAKRPENENDRDIGIRVGYKTALVKVMALLGQLNIEEKND